MSDWIEHDGNGMPVDGNTLVYVKLKNGWTDEDHHKPVEASFWDDSESYDEDSNWHSRYAGEYVITHYKVVA